jgi:hypothetical protein
MALAGFCTETAPPLRVMIPAAGTQQRSVHRHVRFSQNENMSENMYVAADWL